MMRRQRTVDISALIRRKVCTISLSPRKDVPAPDKEYLLELTDGLLPLDIHSFDKDALILENSQVKEVTLYNKEKKPYLSLYFDTPVVGLWSPPAKNAPFVCIEPWYGRCDRAPL